MALAPNGGTIREELSRGPPTPAGQDRPPESLPEYHLVENGELRFHLEPGSDVEVSVRAVPRDRPVRIIEKGATLTEEPH